jgi:small-conductance mechanosensitive channel
MRYSEEIFEHLFEGTEESWQIWFNSHEPLDQIDILNEVKEMIAEVIEEGEENKELSEALKKLEERTHNFQESVLDEQLALLQLEMAEDEIAKIIEELDPKVERIREYILECITTNAPNAEAMKLLAIQAVNYEKATGKYDPLNWLAYNPDQESDDFRPNN